MSRSPFIIGVAGGTASGKTSVCHAVMSQISSSSGGDSSQVVLISMDSFYRVLSEDALERAYAGEYNFDHPDAFDWDLLYAALDDIRSGRPTLIPTYCFVTHSRLETTTLVSAPSVVLIEGLLILFDKRIRDMLSMAIFTDEDSDTRLARRTKRDLTERGRDVASVIKQYLAFVKPAFDEYIFPTKKYADVILPRGKENNVAIDIIVQHIDDVLKERAGPRKAVVDPVAMLARVGGSVKQLEYAEISQ